MSFTRLIRFNLGSHIIVQIGCDIICHRQTTDKHHRIAGNFEDSKHINHLAMTGIDGWGRMVYNGWIMSGMVVGCRVVMISMVTRCCREG